MSTLGFMCAGLVAATVNYPFDRVKGHMMGRAFQVMKKEVAPESTVGAFRSVVARHGPLGLLQGLPTRSVLHAVVWCVVGAGREICEKCGLRERAKQRLATCFQLLSAISRHVATISGGAKDSSSRRGRATPWGGAVRSAPEPECGKWGHTGLVLQALELREAREQASASMRLLRKLRKAYGKPTQGT